ncbi:MAG: asparagine synthase-related protein, partial [Candidatus Woesearchaeota archaeon]|nr:asparagine synthase-related protein [Candidatus Woesearchaeota archaeon]
MCEWYARKGSLISEEEWHDSINSFSNLKNELVSDESFASEKLMELFLSAVKKRISGKNERMGVLFSGGIDSTLIAFSAEKLGFNP